MKCKYLIIIIFLFAILKCNAQQPNKSKTIKISQDEKVWAGMINDGYLMPIKENYELNFLGDNKGNQAQPLLLTNKGQFIWSENPFAFKLINNEIVIQDVFNTVLTGKAGNTLAEVQKYVREKYFPASGKLPDTIMFSRPQYNTWIELTYHQNQTDVLKYAHAIIDNGLPAGVLMIDGSWQEDYGVWDFHPRRFQDPKKMVAELHELGFKVMLWICPFISPDQFLICDKLVKSKALLLAKTKEEDTWDTQTKPAIIEWWDGQSAVLDFSNPTAVKWFDEQLQRLMKDYGIDGFKFDAGDTEYYPSYALSKTNASSNEQCELFAQFGLKYPLNEYRACWKMGGQPLVQRLRDKEHTWTDLQKLIPNMIVEGLAGYPFSCPDLIGGGEWTSFLDGSAIDQDLIVRSAQCHALMPMMQFSVAPWRVLDQVHLNAVKKAIVLRQQFVPVIMKSAHEAAINGEPILKSMEYVFPDQGFAENVNQFMLGNDILVAPVVLRENVQKVKLPIGKWKYADGKVYKGGQTIELKVPIDELPYFQRVR